jgi:eukaryotic-like serine/threonine-protein kinase
MSTVYPFDDDLVRRLPLPLAQLYRRAHGAHNALDRHNAAYYLWEAALKLLGSAAVVAYAERGEHTPDIDEKLTPLARPMVGHWWSFVRLLVPVLAKAGEGGFPAIDEFLNGRSRDDLPRASGLDAALRGLKDGSTGSKITVRVPDLFDRLVWYRNKEFGHGASGLRPPEFYDRMGRSLMAGITELLNRLDVLGGRTLIFVAEVHLPSSEGLLLQGSELIGEIPRPLRDHHVPELDASRRPRPGRLYLADHTDLRSLRSLHPLVVYDPEAGEVLFLNARDRKLRSEYLCYHSGNHADRGDLGVDQRELLGRLLNAPVAAEQVDAWAARSQAEEPSSPADDRSEVRTHIGEFELISLLGQGGMGKVYRAWQPSLGREVALKCLMRVGDPKSEARFNREIHSLGRVEHPNLVKIFTSGSQDDDWFYAMELVEGATLASVCSALQSRSPSASDIDIDTWHASLSKACEETREAEKPLSGPKADSSLLLRASAEADAAARPQPSKGKSYVRLIVGLIRQVAEAAHALHEAGIVHRDIKPGNIMVTAGADGDHAVLMDLGLAHLAVEGARMTQTRQFVGTLRYASREQVFDSSRVDRRSDVYSLGATLWELLTLRPLFDADKDYDLQQQIINRDVDRLRKFHKGIPPDLEAIVAKCLEKNPTRRYATAAELADDLQNWLRGDLVKAQPLTWQYVASKFARRYRARIAAALVLALVAAGGVMLAFYNINKALGEARKQRNIAVQKTREAEESNQRLQVALLETEKQHQEAETQKARAEENFRKARKVVDDYMTKISENKLLNVPGAQNIRKELLEGALKYYDEFLKQRSDDPSLQSELAEAYFHVARINSSIGTAQESTDAYLKAIEIRERLVREHPEVDKYRSDLAWAYNNLGFEYRGTGQYAKAQESHAKALPLREKLASDHPENDEYQSALAYSFYNQATLYGDVANTALEEEYHKKALAIREKLAEKHPKNNTYLEALGWSQSDLGLVFSKTGRTSQALQLYRQAQEVRDQLVKQNPESLVYRGQLAQSDLSLGLLYTGIQQPIQGYLHLKRGLPVFEQLARDNPAVTDYQINLANAYSSIGLLDQLSLRSSQAIENSKKALLIYEKLTAAHPTVVAYRRALAIAHESLALSYSIMNRTADVETEYDQARVIWQQLVNENPQVADYQHSLAMNYSRHGDWLSKTGQPARALEVFEQALSILERLARDFPATSGHRSSLADLYANVGGLKQMAGKYAEALESYKKSLDIYDVLYKYDADLFININGLSIARQGMALAHQSLGQPEMAVADYRENIRLVEKMAQAIPSSGRPLLAEAYHNLGLALWNSNKTAEAATSFQKAIEIREGLIRDKINALDPRPELAGSYESLAALYQSTSQAEKSTDALKKAAALREELLREKPDDHDLQRATATAYNDLGYYYETAGKFGEAEPSLTKSLALWEKLAKDHPQSLSDNKNLGITLKNLGDLAVNQKKLDEAANWLSRAIDQFELARGLEPKNAQVLGQLYTSHWARANALTPLDRHAEELKEWDQVIALADAPNLPNLKALHAGCLARMGNYEQAVAEIKIELDSAQDTLYNSACAYSLASAAVLKDQKLPQATRTTKANQYASRAVEVLAGLARGDFFKAPASAQLLQEDKDLLPLHDRDDFRSLLKGIAAQDIPANKPSAN